VTEENATEEISEPDDAARQRWEALAEQVRSGRIRRVALERVDGQPVTGSDWAQLLLELGFRQGPRALTLTA
jgi:ATP-dependent Lhr-like helicase